MGLIKSFKECKKYRKDYKIKPSIRFEIDTYHYCFSFLPTIVWCPWICRPQNTDGIIDIWWFNFHILIGYWERINYLSDYVYMENN